VSLLAAVDAQTLVDAVGLGAVYALMAVGIGLVFGVLRLVNFAYGQLVMAGAYTLAFTSAWPAAGSILACFAVVVALSLAMERAVHHERERHDHDEAGDDAPDDGPVRSEGERVGARHDQLPVGEVDEAEHPEHEADPDRHQCVDGAEADCVGKRLGIDGP